MADEKINNNITSAVLSEYDEVLLGHRKSYSAYFMSTKNKDRVVVMALRYCFEQYLHWSPIEVRERLDRATIERMKIGMLINRVPCPPEIDKKNEFCFVAWYLYPQTKNISNMDLMIKVYDDVLAGRAIKYPKGYFDGTVGQIHAKAIFLTMVQRYLTFSSVEEMYAFFADEKLSKPIMVKYRLSVPLRELYKSPLEYMHDALSSSQKREDLYNKYTNPTVENETVDEDDGDDYYIPYEEEVETDE